MNNSEDTFPSGEPESGSLRSPVRPSRPTDQDATRRMPIPRRQLTEKKVEPSAPPQDPTQALEQLRAKMEAVANEFATGKLNRAQFNAIYGRYSEQRTLIERLIERNANSDAWRQAAAPGHTTFLREHFEARSRYFLVYKRGEQTPLMESGPQQPDMQRMTRVVRNLWKQQQHTTGLARLALGNNEWLVIALGQYSLTLALFVLEPSLTQINRVRDLHADFERANQFALRNETSALDRMVFPQRALVE